MLNYNQWAAWAGEAESLCRQTCGRSIHSLLGVGLFNHWRNGVSPAEVVELAIADKSAENEAVAFETWLNRAEIATQDMVGLSVSDLDADWLGMYEAGLEPAVASDQAIAEAGLTRCYKVRG